jgi:hypothetical protein
MDESHRPVKDTDSDGDYVEFAPAGADGKGEFKCAGCGYGITVSHKLPRCPMCGEGLWERPGAGGGAGPAPRERVYA